MRIDWRGDQCAATSGSSWRGDETHTALQTPLFYSQDADGVLLNEWTKDFLKDKRGWVDIVEEPVP